MDVTEQQYLEEAFDELSKPTQTEQSDAHGRCEYFMRILSTLDAEDKLIKEQYKLRQAEINAARKSLYFYKYEQFKQDINTLDFKGKKSITFLHGKAGTRKKNDALEIIDNDTYIDWVQDHIPENQQDQYLKKVITPYKTILNTSLKDGSYTETGLPPGTEFVPAHEAFFPKDINQVRQELF